MDARRFCWLCLCWSFISVRDNMLYFNLTAVWGWNIRPWSSSSDWSVIINWEEKIMSVQTERVAIYEGRFKLLRISNYEVWIPCQLAKSRQFFVHAFSWFMRYFHRWSFHRRRKPITLGRSIVAKATNSSFLGLWHPRNEHISRLIIGSIVQLGFRVDGQFRKWCVIGVLMTLV